MPRLPSETVGICPFSESPYKGKPCLCVDCNLEQKCTNDCSCYVSEGVVYDCEGPVTECDPPTDECIHPGSGFCGEFCLCVECKDNPKCPKKAHCDSSLGDVVTNCAGRVLTCAVAKK
jgi:hypothetical protein